jgi:hypothetical protein
LRATASFLQSIPIWNNQYDLPEHCRWGRRPGEGISEPHQVVESERISVGEAIGIDALHILAA